MKTVLNNHFESFEDYLNECAPVLKEYFLQNLENVINSFEKIKHKDVDKYLYDPIRKYAKNFGKLHRPLLCLATYMAAGGDVSKVDEVVPIACSIENFQNAALIHDDIADDGQLRRGTKCMHLTEGLGLAINAGDYGLASTVGGVAEFLRQANYDKMKNAGILKPIVYMEYMTIEGQAMDLGWARDGRFDISEKDYIVMATKKSALYSVAVPCVLGAFCADANNNVCYALRDFGVKVGVAFQIQDDLLNLIETEDSEKIKDFRNDITEGKRTLMVCKALEMSDQKDRLIEILQKHTNDKKELDEAVQIMIDCGAVEYAQNKAKSLCEEGNDILNRALPTSQWTDLLMDMGQWVIERGN